MHNPSISIYPELIEVLKSIFMIFFGLIFGILLIYGFVGNRFWFRIFSILFILGFSGYLWYIGVFRKLFYWRFKLEIMDPNTVKITKTSIFMFSKSQILNHNDDLIVFIRRWSKGDETGEAFYLQSSQIKRSSGLYRMDQEFAVSRASFTQIYLFLRNRANAEGFEYYQPGSNFVLFGSLDSSPEKANAQLREIVNKEDIITKYQSRFFLHPLFIYTFSIFGFPTLSIWFIVVQSNGLTEFELWIGIIIGIFSGVMAIDRVERYYTMQLLIESSESKMMDTLETEIVEFIKAAGYDVVNESDDSVELIDTRYHLWYVRNYSVLQMISEDDRLKLVGPKRMLKMVKILVEDHTNRMVKISFHSESILK